VADPIVHAGRYDTGVPTSAEGVASSPCAGATGRAKRAAIGIGETGWKHSSHRRTEVNASANSENGNQSLYSWYGAGQFTRRYRDHFTRAAPKQQHPQGWPGEIRQRTGGRWAGEGKL